MAVFLPEPHAMAISRTPSPSKFHDDSIDYRMLPRSSGDGMEHSGSSQVTEASSNSSHSSTNYKSYKTDSAKSSHDTIQSTSGSLKTETLEIYGDSPVRSLPTTQNKVNRTHHEVTSEHLIRSDVRDIDYHRKDSLDYTRKNTLKSYLSSKEESSNIYTSTSNYSNDSLNHDATKSLKNDIFEDILTVHKDDNDFDENKHFEETISNEEVLRLQNTIKDLEERNTKLVEDKTKLCVQLGYQTEVNAELKKLVVAAVGEDLENNLEALLMKNAQSTVEIKHWKTLSEEYAEESDKLAIECDVWRTKFMASRMMSDELSTWKTTLYTKYKQAQSAIQRILKEREELKKYLSKTNRLLHVLGDSLNVGSTSHKHSSSDTFNESVLELASVICSHVQGLTNSLVGEVDSVSVCPENNTISDNSVEKQNVKPTPGEQIAIQVLTSDVELHTDDQLEDSSVMKRLGKQYIGNSYHSRLLTNTFRVTYDCCDRCKGPVQVV